MDEKYNSQNKETPDSAPIHSYAPGYNGTPGNKEINLAQLFKLIWREKWIIGAFTVAFAIASVVFALSLSDIYRAETRVAPAEGSRSGGLSRMSSELGGLASLAGVQLPQGQAGKAELAVEIIRSRKFLSDFIERRNILPDLMAVESWDASNGGIKYNEDAYDVTTGTWHNEELLDEWQAVNDFREILFVEYDPVLGFGSIAIEHQSPVVAKQWVDWLVEDINNEIRANDIDEAVRSREYLEEELSRTNLTSMQRVFHQLVESQVHTIMMANVRPEYVFRVIDPAVVPGEKAAPARALICIFGTFLGCALGFLVVFIRYLVQNQNS